jgi:hypothetical protein
LQSKRVFSPKRKHTVRLSTVVFGIRVRDFGSDPARLVGAASVDTMAGETPRKRRHLGAALAFLLACGVCFSIGAYVGASPTDPLGVRDILGVGNANVARPIAQHSTRAQTECPRPVKCEPPPRCEPEEIVREVQVERECPACEACPKVPEEAPEEAEEASDAASEESKPAAGVATNPLLAAARPEKEPTARVEGKLDTSGDAGDANGDAIAEDGVPVPVPVPVECPLCAPCAPCAAGACPDAPACDDDEDRPANASQGEPPTCPACDACPACAEEGEPCPKHDPCPRSR